MARKRTRPSKAAKHPLVDVYPNARLDEVRAALKRYPVAKSFHMDHEPRNRRNQKIVDHFAIHAYPGADISLFFAILDNHV